MNYQTQIKKVHKFNYSFFFDNSLKFLNSYFISRKNLIKTQHEKDFAAAIGVEVDN